MEKLRIGVIGTGNIARKAHLPGWQLIEEAEVVALCDVNTERARVQSELYGNVPVYTDYQEMIEKEQLDAVDICTPNYLHSVIAVYALEHGLHVFCEKPDAVSAAEAERMREAAEKSGKTLMVMRNNRYLPTSAFIKQYIDDGRMGEIYAARCGWQRRRGIPGRGGWFTNKEQSGGGPLIDLGVHMIDLTMWLMGNPKPVAVSGCTYTKFADNRMVEAHGRDVDLNGVFDVEDLAMGFIRFENGASLQIEFSWASNIEKERRFFELRGTRSGAEWSSDSDRLAIYTEEYGRTADILPNIDNKKSMPPHAANLKHFTDVVLHGTEPMFVPQQGINMVRILEAMYRSAAEGHEIRL